LFREDLGRPKYEFYTVYMDSTGMVGEFSMGNEPSLAIPYLYNHLGAPWKTQKRVRQLLDSWFTDTLLGMPGDEDGGGMSAFVVFSMMGIYPVEPGIPVYELCSPVFDRVAIRLHNGKTLKIICKNNSRDNKYIQSVRFNGQPQRRVWFRHSDVLKGLTIELEMSNVPNTALGSDPADQPAASLAVDPRTFE
jgi:predicted alpha-1,2-mannosidase